MEYRKSYALIERGSGLIRIIVEDAHSPGDFEVIERCYDNERNPNAEVFWWDYRTDSEVAEDDVPGLQLVRELENEPRPGKHRR